MKRYFCSLFWVHVCMYSKIWHQSTWINLSILTVELECTVEYLNANSRWKFPLSCEISEATLSTAKRFWLVVVSAGRYRRFPRSWMESSAHEWDGSAKAGAGETTFQLPATDLWENVAGAFSPSLCLWLARAGRCAGHVPTLRAKHAPTYHSSQFLPYSAYHSNSQNLHKLSFLRLIKQFHYYYYETL